jgi:hypothetical protein
MAEQITMLFVGKVTLANLDLGRGGGQENTCLKSSLPIK